MTPRTSGPHGASPPGVAGQTEAALWVRAMFGRVARRYDLLNHLLSFNLDRRWRALAASRVRDVLSRTDARAADLCCGTGDLLLALETGGGAVLIGSDFSRPMLEQAARKIAARRSRAMLVEADALRLPFPSESLDLVTAAFGFRNLASYTGGLREMLRVLRPGGTAAILEFSTPRNRVFAALYRVYSRRVLPAVGGVVSGSRAAYEYLPESVRRFPGAAELAAQMRAEGFRGVTYECLAGGIVALHLGRK